MRLWRGKPIFFGWWIVVAALLMGSVMIFIQIYMLAVTQVPMARSLRVSRSAIVVSVTLGTLVAGATPTVAGLSVALVQQVWQFYIAFFFIAAGSALGSQVLANVVVPRWFVRRRSQAVSYAAMGTSGGAIFLLPLTNVLIGA